MTELTGSQITWFEMFPGVRRSILVDGDKVMVVHVRLDAGATVPRHQHPHEQATYVVNGNLRFTVNDQSSDLKAGEAIHLPSNAPHSVLALEDSLVVDVFSPPREDFR